MIKRILIAVLFAPLLALAQSYPSPTFQNLTVRGTYTGPAPVFTSPLPVSSGGTGSNNQAGALSNILGSSTVPVANGGTASASASGTALDNITGFASTGFLTRTGAGAYSFQSLTNGITLGNLAKQAANTVLANATGSTANVTAFAMPSCSGATNALGWTSGTGFACNGSVNAATLGGATFASPGTIGGTTPGQSYFSGVGVGVSSTGATMDVESTGAAGNPSANSTLARFYSGSAGTPVTVINPTVGISRYEALTGIDTEGGQNAALYVQGIGNNNSVPGTYIGQVNAITADATQQGYGDAVGFFTYARNNSTSGGTAFGGFFDAIANTSVTYAYAIETFSTNNTGANAPLTIGSQPKIVGLHITPNGSYNGTAALWLDKNSNGGSNVWDSGVYLAPSSMGTYGFLDASNSTQSLTIQGAHTYGIVMNNGTYSGAQIQATGWQLGSNGTVVTSISPTSNWNVNSTGSTVSITTGSNAAFTAGNGLITVEESASSNSAVYLCSVGACTLIGSNGGVWVASTTTPAAGKMSVAYSGSAYAIYNNQGTTETVTVYSVKMKATN